MSAIAAVPSRAAALRPGPIRIALLGNPNTGKTTLFNRLCGARAKTSNFPGTTTARRDGHCDLGGVRVDVIDLPGLYQLHLSWPEARIVRDVLRGAAPHRAPDAIVVVADASNLARNLVLAGELLAEGRPLVVALNMIDVAARRGWTVDAVELSRRLGAPVVPIVASKGIGLAALREAIAGVVNGGAAPARLPNAPTPETTTVEALTDWAGAVVDAVVSGSTKSGAIDTRTERVDRVLTHPVLGTIVFVAVMGVMFYALFALAQVPMDLIDGTFGALGDLVRRFLPDGPLRALVIDGVIGGIAGTLVFLPQIALLFFLISLLEDTGYLARAAFVNDRFFSRFGLPGQAFVPLLTAHACAVPGIMSTRLIPNRRDRLATILVLPFMSCSARLPVYVLLTSLLFAGRPGLAGLAFAGCYLLGAGAAFVTAALAGRTILRGRARPMVLELPSFKTPSLMNAGLTAWDQAIAFLRTAGTTIFAICVVMWALSAYPASPAPPRALELRAQAAQPQIAGTTQAAALLADADALESRTRQAGSLAGRLGHAVEPVFRPLGYDWQLTDALLTSFVAREVFVSTMSVLAGAGTAGDRNDGVLARIRTMKREDGRLVFTPATSASALVFFVLAMQCLATLTVTRRESGGLRWAAIQFVYMSTVAYVAAFAVTQALRVAGIS